MGRRNRNRAKTTSTEETVRAAPTRMARVQVDDHVWHDFQQAIHPHSIARALGELVTREVDRHRSRRLRAGELDDADVTTALAEADRQRQDLAAITRRLEALRGRREPASRPPARQQQLGADWDA